MGVPVLAGIHHVKLPVSDLERSMSWYESRLGYRRTLEFVERGRLMGLALSHPNGGPDLALRLDPDLAVGSAGFDYFTIGVPDRAAIEALAERLTGLGESHAGVHFASLGWILPMLHDPDGHEIRFYTVERHADPSPAEVTRIQDPREAAERRAGEPVDGESSARLSP